MRGQERNTGLTINSQLKCTVLTASLLPLLAPHTHFR